MNKSAAIREARAQVGPIIRRGPTSFVFTRPYNLPGGPCTEVQCCNYWEARARRSRALADVAQELMSRHD